MMYRFLFVLFFSLWSVMAFSQIHAVPDYYTPKPDKYLGVHLMDKETYRKLYDHLVEQLLLCIKGDTINLKEHRIPTANFKYNFAGYFYNDAICDSMTIIAKVPGYRDIKHVYCLKIHRLLSESACIMVSKPDYYPNELIVEGDRIEVNLGKDSVVYDAAKLRRSKKEDIMETLSRLPGLEVDDTSVKINGKPLQHAFIHTVYYCPKLEPIGLSIKDLAKKIKKYQE